MKRILTFILLLAATASFGQSCDTVVGRVSGKMIPVYAQLQSKAGGGYDTVCWYMNRAEVEEYVATHGGSSGCLSTCTLTADATIEGDGHAFELSNTSSIDFVFTDGITIQDVDRNKVFYVNVGTQTATVGYGATSIELNNDNGKITASNTMLSPNGFVCPIEGGNVTGSLSQGEAYVQDDAKVKGVKMYAAPDGSDHYLLFFNADGDTYIRQSTTGTTIVLSPPVHANNAAAILAGLEPGAVYTNGTGGLFIVYTP